MKNVVASQVIETGTIVGDCAHNEVLLALADKVVAAVQSGAQKNL